jgi:6-phosphogluconolactonase
VNGPPALHVHEEDAAAHAARAVADALRDAIARRGSARLAVAGGSVVPVLARTRALVPEAWPHVSLTWVDERRVPHADAASNFGAARTAGVLDAPCAQCVLPLVNDDELADAAQARARVAAALAREFSGALDVTLLGLGEDGHIASLFPGLPWDDGGARVFTLDHAPKPPPARITLSRAFIATAATHVVYAIGEGKRAALTRVLAGDPGLPLTGFAGVQVFTDLHVEPASIG